jgi:hypothetical protein
MNVKEKKMLCEQLDNIHRELCKLSEIIFSFSEEE